MTSCRGVELVVAAAGFSLSFPSLSRLPFGSFPNSNIWRKMITLATLPRRLINNSTLSRSVGLQKNKELVLVASFKSAPH